LLPPAAHDNVATFHLDEAHVAMPSRPFATPPGLSTERRAFGARLRALRKRFFGKQWALSEDAACSQAAVSQWEAGRRLPDRATFHRLLEALAAAGAAPNELSGLEATWWAETVGRIVDEGA
jgi:DNA-binding transcriptional regulator YiaG